MYLHIHSKEEIFPSTHGITHAGYWPKLLDDGTYFITIRTGDIGVTKQMVIQAAALHPEAGVTVIPTMRSGKVVEPSALVSLNHHFGSNSAKMTGQEVVTSMFQKHGDPIYDPDGMT